MELRCVVFVRARLECVDPCLIVGVSDLLCKLFLERAYVWVCVGLGAMGVTLADDGFGKV